MSNLIHAWNNDMVFWMMLQGWCGDAVAGTTCTSLDRSFGASLDMFGYGHAKVQVWWLSGHGNFDHMMQIYDVMALRCLKKTWKQVYD